ncbi:MAG: SDR family NAD(P)-dependent oxidoreductase [Actinomycetota bacterium]
MDASALNRLLDFSGQTAIVTGGTRGIGRAIAEGLAAGGANVVVASRKADACAETQTRLETMGAQALGVPLNMGDPAGVEALVAATVERFGGVDILINNAANALAAPIGQQTDATWDKSFEVNLRGPALLTQAAVPHLAEAEHASVVNVISVGAFQFARGVSMYAAMKAGLLSLTRSSAGELADRGIRVNALAPGPVDTDMTRNLGEGAPEAMGKGTLLGRPAQPDEMVGPALFLAGRGSSYVTGQVLIADGGMHPH